MPRRVLALAACALLAACAEARLPARGIASRAAITPGRADAVFGAAVAALEERGYRVASCDPGIAALVTERLELDAPCPLGSCLARQKVTLKLGYRTAKLVLSRQVWDYGAKTWLDLRDPAVERDEAALLREVVRRGEATTLHAAVAPPCPEGDPCADGGCVAAR